MLSLVKEAISCVDPNARNGDLLDIRPYVKIKIIPGNIICAYIECFEFNRDCCI